MRQSLLSLALAGGLLWAGTGVAQTDIIRETRAAVAEADFDLAEAIARDGLAERPSDPQAIEALSWVARGALAADDLNLALTVARETRRLAEEALAGRSPNVDQNLEIALGAAIEVQAQVLARRGSLTDAVYLLERAVEQYAGTAYTPGCRRTPIC